MAKKTEVGIPAAGFWAVTRGGQVEVDKGGRLEVYVSRTMAEVHKLSWQEIRPVAVQIRSR
jgi:hypothetical protein